MNDKKFFLKMTIEFRTRLDLFANVIRCKSSPVVPTRHSDIDILVIRENTEGEYSSLEHEVSYSISSNIFVNACFYLFSQFPEL